MAHLAKQCKKLRAKIESMIYECIVSPSRDVTNLIIPGQREFG